MDYAQLGTTPIPGDAPTGVDPAYLPEFDALSAELEKLGKVDSSGQGIDWTKVRDLSAGILANKSKHLPSAVYLAAALIKLDGIAGFALGVKLLAGLVASWWEGMFPPLKRLRGRLQALAWWKEQTQAFVEAFSTEQTFPAEFIDGLARDLRLLDGTLAEKSPDAPPLTDLIGFASRLPVAQTAPPAAENPPEQKPAAATQPAAESLKPATEAAPKAQPLSSDDPRALLAAGLDALKRAGYALLEHNPGDPQALRATRLGVWAPIAELPPAETGKTRIPYPAEPPVGTIAALIAQAQFADALRAVESHFPTFPFWLDLQRLAAQALKGFGAGAGAKVVEAETLDFLDRLPGVERLAFDDGTPFADGPTRSWLAELAPKAQVGDEDDPLSKIEAEATAAAGAGPAGLPKALGVTAAALKTAGAGRDKFRLKLFETKLLTDFGQPLLAAPGAGELLGLIDAHHLEVWEPDQAAQGLAVAYRALALKEDETAKAKDVLARLAALSPAAALEITLSQPSTTTS